MASSERHGKTNAEGHSFQRGAVARWGRAGVPTEGREVLACSASPLPVFAFFAPFAVTSFPGDGIGRSYRRMARSYPSAVRRATSGQAMAARHEAAEGKSGAMERAC